MNTRLDAVVTEARAALTEAEQGRLADIVEAYVASHGDAVVLSPAQQEEVARRHAAPFDAAPEDEVAQFFTAVLG